MTLLLALSRSRLAADRLLWQSERLWLAKTGTAECLGLGSSRDIGHETEFPAQFKNYRNNCVKGSEHPTQIDSLIMLTSGRYRQPRLVPG